MNYFNFKRRNLFSGPHLLGLLLIFAGFVALVSPLIFSNESSLERILAVGGGAITLGMVIVSSYGGTLIDFKGNRLKEYNSIGGYKLGEWTKMPVILSVKVISTSYISTNTPNGISPTLFALYIGPQISEQINQLSEEMPETINSVKEKLEESPQGRKLIEQIPEDPQKWLQEKGGLLKDSLGVFSATFGVFADLYVILFMGLFMMAQPEPYQKGIVKLVPLSQRGRAREVIDKLGTTLQRWIAGKLFSMLVVAVLSSIGLWMLGVPLPLALGCIAGLLSFIPNFGPLVALVPAVLLGFTQGPDTALYVALLYIGIQAVESNLITPLVQKQMVYIPPAMILGGQVLLGILVGGLGLILATPILAIIMVLTNMLYIEDVLGDNSEQD